MKNFKEIVYGNLFEAKVKNPGPYIDGARAKAGVDTDGDGVPDGADEDPKDGAVKEEVEIAEEILEEEDKEDTDE
jgi:hypothetical protein